MSTPEARIHVHSFLITGTVPYACCTKFEVLGDPKKNDDALRVGTARNHGMFPLPLAQMTIPRAKVHFVNAVVPSEKNASLLNRVVIRASASTSQRIG